MMKCEEEYLNEFIEIALKAGATAAKTISSQKVVQELRETPLKIRQKIVKLSQDRLGIYFNNNVVRSLDLKKGEEIFY